MKTISNWLGMSHPHKSLSLFVIAFGSIALLLTWTTSAAAQSRPTPVKEFEKTGKVRSIKAGQITVQHGKGDRQVYKIQDKDQRALSLEGKHIVRLPCKIDVYGTLPAKLIERGMILEFEGKINRFGKTKETVKEFKVLDADASSDIKLDLEKKPEGSDIVACSVIGRVMRFSNGKVRLTVPKSKMARNERIEFQVDPEGTMDLKTDNLKRVRSGDTIKQMTIVELSDGTQVVKEIEIELTAKREVATISYHEQLEQKYSDLSDDPMPARELTSDNFIIYTDLSERSASILLAKLETMHFLISKYFGRRPSQAIECFVVRDLRTWNGPQIPPVGIAKIAEGAGVTASATVGKRTKSYVFSCDDHGVVQHEAVHAYCSQLYGDAGPVWFAEGMAELGQYWKPGELAVNIDPVVIDYLTHAEPKKMADIVAAGQITGDSWQAYAWRWALCHLLASNPNYAKRFKRLGINMMSGERDSFEEAFGSVATQISFEYDQFVQNFGNGYRVDLCVWDWNTRASNIGIKGRSKATVKAQAGWQATKLLVKEGVSYDYVCQGKWRVTTDGEEIDADGNEDDDGRLVGVILDGFELIGPFELGTKGKFTPPVSGQLYLRCDDLWTELADNDGEIKTFFRRTPSKPKSSGTGSK